MANDWLHSRGILPSVEVEAALPPVASGLLLVSVCIWNVSPLAFDLNAIFKASALKRHTKHLRLVSGEASNEQLAEELVSTSCHDALCRPLIFAVAVAVAVAVVGVCGQNAAIQETID